MQRGTRYHARALGAMLTLASFLGSMSPARFARADDAPLAPAAPVREDVAPEKTPAQGDTSEADRPSEHEGAARPEAPIARPTSGTDKPTSAGAPVSNLPDPLRVPAGSLGRTLQPESVPVAGNDKTGASSQAIALPQGTGKVQGMGESFSMQLSTGVASYSVPFSLEPARGGAQPSLALSYSSGSGTGVAGMGWDVGVPFISRQTDRGIPQYDDPAPGGPWQPTQDRFIFNGGQELIPICQVQGGSCSGAVSGEVMPCWASQWQYFRPRVEGGFLRFFWSPDHRTWRVQSKSGTSMELGAPLDASGYTGALETDPTGQKIFRWDLVREYDAYGGANACTGEPTPVNIVSYRYQQDGAMAYLSDIYDTPPATSPSTATLAQYAHHTHLDYETRTDPTTSYRRGWQTIEEMRLSGVDVTSQTFAAQGNREMVRRYHLAYDPTYHVSLLASLQMEGRCNTTEGGPGAVSEDNTGELPSTSCPMLPAMTFGYQHVTGYNIDGSQQAADLRGYEPFDDRVIPFANSPNYSLDDAYTDLFDINADGLPDVLSTNPGNFGGDFGVYLNGPRGTANSFGPALNMPVLGVNGDTAQSMTLANLNVVALDLNGDGTVDLVHMPQVQDYSYYTAQGSGTNFSFVGNAVAAASQQSPILDFGDDAMNFQAMDVNGDGLIDLVHSTGTQMDTFLSLGRYPNGNGQFGSAQWTGPTTSQIDNNPITYGVPYGGLPIAFDDSNTRLADMNGDGLQDIVYTLQGNITYWPGRGNGYWGTGDPSACPAGGFCQNTGIAMTSSPWYSDPNGSALHLDDINGDGLDDLVQIGFNFVEVWLNVDGTSWTAEHLISNAPNDSFYQTRVRLVDANGTGTRDVLWGDAQAYRYIDFQGGVRPWVLTHVANGLGKTTDLQYESSTQLMLAAAKAGQPWSSLIPQVVEVVTQVTDNDNLSIVGQPEGKYVTQYSYANPVYDGRQREFRGFENATTTKVGDTNSPTSVSTSSFLLGQCKNDENESPSPCTDDGRWEDDPREALKGLPLVSETYDPSTYTYLSTAHHTYRLRKLYTGLDGREVHYAFESQGDSYLYDTGSFLPVASTTAMTDVELELTLGAVSADTTESMQLRATSGRAHTHKSSQVDAFGNATSATDDGVLGTDDSITSTTVAQMVSAPQCSPEPSGWLYRSVESYVTSSQFPARRKDTAVSYDCGGNPVQTTAMLSGTLPLNRFYSDTATQPANWNGVAPAPANASQDGKILLSTETYDGQGMLTEQTGPDGRCRTVAYDKPYDQIPFMESVDVGALPVTAPATGANCGVTALPTVVQQYDRGLDVVVQVQEPRNELTTATYDGFGRITSVTKPDPTTLGKSSAQPSVQIQYILPTDWTKTPYTIVNTQTLGGADDPTTGIPSYRNAWAFADGLGRAIVTLDQADPTAGDGGQWIIDGLQAYDAKGAVQRAYLAWFWNGTAQQFSLSTNPTTAYGSQNYDAFGRKLQTYNLDGTISLQSSYHALSVDKWDAADLQPGPHQGTPATATQDGHGRTVQVTERVHNGSALEEHYTSTTYLSTGEPAIISRTTTSGAAPVSRWILYDTLGRMVLNMEPDATPTFSQLPVTNVQQYEAVATGGIPPTFPAWRYAYNDAGDLVGTSDARGCGENYFYDAGGRIVAEDFSPCTSTQPPYTTPNTTTGDGTEAFYVYDSASLDLITPSPASLPAFAATSYLGLLVSESDRGARTATAYDGRARVVATARALPAPGVPNPTISRRYASSGHWFVSTTAYDLADRPVTESTGADVDQLENPPGSGASAVTTQYSQRGTVYSVGSSYGALVNSVTRAADGPINQIVYGDVAGTTTAFSYDTRRRLSSVQTYRGPPAIWSQTPAAYQPAPNPTGPPSTFQLLLQDLDYSYDAVDNPTEIQDFRNPAEWPAGTQPVTRKMQYDDLYRVTQVAYSYPTGTDPWTSPFYAEDQGIDSDPRRSTPAPHVSFSQRVLSQSFQYDWLGNTAQTDDNSHGFYDRSLGTIANGTAAQGPYQLKSAAGTGTAQGGNLTAAYDAAGNLTSLAVARSGSCLPSGTLCSQRFAYEWDEAGRLSVARRWDTSAPGVATDPLPTTASNAELQYDYDASDERTIKTEVGENGNANSYTAYVFDSLELRHAAWSGTDYQQDSSTEVPYLEAHGVRLARLQYALEDEPSASSGALHVFMEMSDHLGSTSIVLDHDTSELVEARGYLGYGQAESDYRPERWVGFREDYGFTGKEEDIELGLEYFGKRYLCSMLGRWASADPLAIHGLGGDPNAYAYVHGSLLNATDPVGLDNSTSTPAENSQNSLGADTVLTYKGDDRSAPTAATQSSVPMPHSQSADAKVGANTLAVPETMIIGGYPSAENLLRVNPGQSGTGLGSQVFPNTPIGSAYNLAGEHSDDIAMVPGIGAAANIGKGTALLADGDYAGGGARVLAGATEIALLPVGAGNEGVSGAKQAVALADKELFGGVRPSAGMLSDIGKVGAENCVNCAIALDRRMAGAATSALDGPGTLRDTSLAVLRQIYPGGTTATFGSKKEMETFVQLLGDGTRGVVFGSRNGAVGHAFNVVNVDGRVVFLDATARGRAVLGGGGYVNFQVFFSQLGGGW